MNSGKQILETIIVSGVCGVIAAIIVGYIIEKLKNK